MTATPSRAAALALAIAALILFGAISAEKAVAGAGQGSLPSASVAKTDLHITHRVASGSPPVLEGFGGIVLKDKRTLQASGRGRAADPRRRSRPGGLVELAAAGLAPKPHYT